MKVLKLVLASGALCVGLNAQTIGLNVFPEYQAKPDQEMLDLAGKIEARKVIEYLSEMKNRYNKMTPKHKADFQKQFQDNLAKNLAKLKPEERQQRLATIKKALAAREANINHLREEVEEEYAYIDYWKKLLNSDKFEEDLIQHGFNAPPKHK
ncbi:hypothetical protein NHP20013_02190 [Helicobacter bizzozeronii]|nr:hypothetical protein NHP20013_02190 [Helicobacter bizzozeronii]